MSALRPQPWLRTLVTVWTLIWMGIAAPCTMAGDLGGAGEPPPHAGAAGQLADLGSAGGHPDAAGDLLCFHNCNQLALGQDLQPLPSPDFGLTQAGSAAAEPGAIEPTGTTPASAAPYPRRATYLLNRTFLI